MGNPARQIHDTGNHRTFKRYYHRQLARNGSLITQPRLLRMPLLHHAAGQDLRASAPGRVGCRPLRVDPFRPRVAHPARLPGSSPSWCARGRDQAPAPWSRRQRSSLMREGSASIDLPQGLVRRPPCRPRRPEETPVRTELCFHISTRPLPSQIRSLTRGPPASLGTPAPSRRTDPHPIPQRPVPPARARPCENPQDASLPARARPAGSQSRR